jgi:hypothetical protein
MKNDQLKYLLKQSAKAAERRPGRTDKRYPESGCHDDYEIASYWEGGLSERDHGRLELHLADCEYCMERIGILGRAGEAETSVQVPEFLQARSARLADSADSRVGRSNRDLWRRAPRWAAAAIVVLSIGVLSQSFSPRPDGMESPAGVEPPGHSDDIRQTRNINPAAMAPNFLSAREGMTMIPGDGIFSWTAVPDSLFYQLRIVSDEGDLVWQGRVNETQWVLPSGLSLAPGAEYFVRVDAFMTEAKALNSDYLLFRVGERR